MECLTESNREECPCTYEPCPRKGQCCRCVSHHRDSDELPGCFFSPAGERTHDRSLVSFLRDRGREGRA